MKEAKIQWHSAFVSAMDLEFVQNRNDLSFLKEYNLNTKPLEIDLVIIKKEAPVQLDSEMYACLYKSYGATVDAIKAEDITISVVRESKPTELFRYLKKQGCEVAEFSSGIYYIKGRTWFPTQIIATRELDADTHRWLKALSPNMNKENFRKLLDERNQMVEKLDRELADSVLEVSISANKKIIEQLIGDESMYETLMEIMEPRIQQRENMKVEEERKKGIKITVKSLRDVGVNEADIRKVIIENYSLSEGDAEEYL